MATERKSFAGIDIVPGTITRKWVALTDVEGGPELPVILIAGAEPGPTFLITAGLHGDEYDGLEAALRISEELDPKALKGNVAVITRVNVRAFDQGRRWSSLDGLDLNRQFPGLRDGFMAQRLAWHMTNTILPDADFVLDYHGGTSELEVVSYGAIVAPSPLQEELQPLLTVKHLWDWSETIGMRGTFIDVVAEAGKPFAIVEIGGNNTWREGPVMDGVRAARNLLRHQGMIAGDYENVPAEQLVLRGTFVHADADGFLRPKVGLGDWVEEGQLLAEIYDLLGQKRCDVRSRVKGVVNDIRTHPSVHCGEWLYLVGRLMERRAVSAPAKKASA